MSLRYWDILLEENGRAEEALKPPETAKGRGYAVALGHKDFCLRICGGEASHRVGAGGNWKLLEWPQPSPRPQ